MVSQACSLQCERMYSKECCLCFEESNNVLNRTQQFYLYGTFVVASLGWYPQLVYCTQIVKHIHIWQNQFAISCC